MWSGFEKWKKRCKENIFTARIVTKNAELKLTVILILIDRLWTVLKKLAKRFDLGWLIYINLLGYLMSNIRLTVQRIAVNQQKGRYRSALHSNQNGRHIKIDIDSSQKVRYS